MKFLIIITFFIYSFSYANAQTGENIIIGKKETIYSKALNENRTLWIYTPEITSQNVNSYSRYPVLYLLDGEVHFISTVGIVHQLSQANGNGVLPEMIVVGIENTNRLRDLTPVVLSSNDLDKTNPFVNFLSSELIPYIEKNYKTAPYRLLVGHSLGGLTAVDILTNFPNLFNAYIAIDPSMWYKSETFLNHTISQLPNLDLSGKKLFIGTANTMPDGFSLSMLKSDNSTETQHIRSIFKLDKFLKTNSNGLEYSQKFYEDERHNTLPLKSEYDGLRFIFDYYFFDATEKDFADSTSLIASKLKSHYIKISEKMGYKVSAPEAFINYLGYDALNKKQYNKAESLFRLNVESYPNSNNVYVSYADFLIAKNDTNNAITYYKKAIKIKEDSSTLRKLNILLNKESYNISIKDLQKYTGVYTLETYNIDIVIEIRDNKLWAKVPGQEDSEFIPVSKDVFTVKDKQNYIITFQMDGDRPTEFTSVQPNGKFRGIYKSN
ncbi:alpha/beta hydrolase-fold protein [Ignavibacterium sp.]|uniref:alpha/beta hydrolase-fold protein n=1 Tax=Ignavibacterium sp. TaxID=2651167 RepID=UPI00307D054E